jgi:hypothetical protein
MPVNYNNYLYLTEGPIQELERYNEETRIIFKYGNGSSNKKEMNERVENRQNLNRAHPDYNNTYQCRTQKKKTEQEKYVHKKLRNMVDIFQCIYTSSTTKKLSEFYYINKKVANIKELNQAWYNLEILISKLKSDYVNNPEEVEQILQNDDNKDEEKEEENKTENKTENNIIDFENFNKEIHTFKESLILYNDTTHNWNPLMRKFLKKYKGKYNNDEYSVVLTTNTTSDNYKIIFDNYYYRNCNLITLYPLFKKMNQQFDLRLKLQLI